MTAILHHPRYRFDRALAAGGMGEVWVATDTLLHREVAVKLLRRQYTEDPVLRARFAAEARNAAALQHPHVASVFDYGEIPVEDGAPLPFLVMELVDGRPLSALLADGRALAPEVAADLVAQAADGVAAAHRQGIVHRDVKPGNLLVTDDGKVKVTDFGVARALDAAPLTLTGHLVGTPNYLSPEQAQGATATAASDIYSLGIVLYQCLTGRPPFLGETAVATALMQIREPLPSFPDDVPGRLQEITRIATAKDPAERYPTMDAMAAALRDQTPATQLLPQPDQPSDDRRSLLRYGLVGLLALLLVAGGIATLVSATDDPPAADTPSVDSSSDDRVRVRAEDYVGMTVEEASRRLDGLGLVVRTRVRLNPGSGAPGTVAGVGPTGLLEPGARVELSAWGPAPLPETPAPEPSDGTGGETAEPPEGSDDDGTGEGTGEGDGESDDTGRGDDKGSEDKGKSDDKGSADKGKSEDKGSEDKGKSDEGAGKGGKNKP